MSTYRIKYDNDTGFDDDGYWESFDIYEDDRYIARCDTLDDAKRIVAALTAFSSPPEKVEG